MTFFNIFDKIKANYGGLNRSIYILFIARVINRMGGFVQAFLALYLSTKLNMTETDIASYIVAVGFFSSVSPFIGGAIADKKGRKAIYVIAQGLAAIILIPCGFLTETSPEIVPFFLVARAMIAAVVGPINSAMVADLTESEEERKKAFALLYLGINVGVAIGPMIGGFLLANYIQIFFIGDAVTTLISVLLILFFVHETKLTDKQMEEVTGNEKKETGFVIRVLFKKPVLLVFVFFGLLNSLVYAQSNYGFSLYMAHLFGDAKGPANYGMLMSFNALVVLALTLPLTAYLRRHRPVYNIAFASLLYTLGFGMYAFLRGPWYVFFLPVFIWTVGEIIGVTHQSVFVISHTPVNYRGRFNAILGLFMGAGYILSPKVFSWFIEGSGYKGAWIFIGSVAFIASLGFVLVGRLDEKINGQGQEI